MAVLTWPSTLTQRCSTQNQRVRDKDKVRWANGNTTVIFPVRKRKCVTGNEGAFWHRGCTARAVYPRCGTFGSVSPRPQRQGDSHRSLCFQPHALTSNTSSLCQRKGRAPEPSITFSCQAWGGSQPARGDLLYDNDNGTDTTP